jgi:hypothetical protein
MFTSKKAETVADQLVNILYSFENDVIAKTENIEATAEAIYNLNNIKAVESYIINYHNNMTYCGASEYFDTFRNEENPSHYEAYTNWLRRLVKETRKQNILHQF